MCAFGCFLQISENFKPCEMIQEAQERDEFSGASQGRLSRCAKGNCQRGTKMPHAIASTRYHAYRDGRSGFQEVRANEYYLCENQKINEQNRTKSTKQNQQLRGSRNRLTIRGAGHREAVGRDCETALISDSLKVV